MKTLLAVVILGGFATTASSADLINLKAKLGNVTYNHKIHSKKAECKFCHANEPYGEFSLDKDLAHTVCKGCHEKQGGPMKCEECHKK